MLSPKQPTNQSYFDRATPARDKGKGNGFHSLIVVGVVVVTVVLLLFYVHGKQLWSCWDGQ